MEHINQQLEAGLCLLSSSNPSTWSQQVYYLLCVYRVVTFPVYLWLSAGTPPPLPDIDKAIPLPLVHTLLRRCRRIWVQARRVMLQSRDRYKVATDHKHSQNPSYTVDQRVWLFTKDLPPCAPCHTSYHNVSMGYLQ